MSGFGTPAGASQASVDALDARVDSLEAEESGSGADAETVRRITRPLVSVGRRGTIYKEGYALCPVNGTTVSMPLQLMADGGDLVVFWGGFYRGGGFHDPLPRTPFYMRASVITPITDSFDDPAQPVAVQLLFNGERTKRVDPGALIFSDPLGGTYHADDEIMTRTFAIGEGPLGTLGAAITNAASTTITGPQQPAVGNLYGRSFYIEIASTLATLAEDLDTTETAIDVSGAAPAALQTYMGGGGSPSVSLIVDNEQMTLTAGQAGTTWTVARGVNSTGGQTHTTGAAVKLVERVLVTAGTTGTSWTVTRAQAGTLAAVHAITATVGHMAEIPNDKATAYDANIWSWNGDATVDVVTPHTNEGQHFIFTPMGVAAKRLADPGTHCVFTVGDSRSHGQGDTVTSTGDPAGFPDRACVATGTPMLKGAAGGTSLQTWTLYPFIYWRLAVELGATIAVLALGTNSGIETAETFLAQLDDLIDMCNDLGILVIVCTIPPKTDPGNTPSIYDVNRVGFNQGIRALATDDRVARVANCGSALGADADNNPDHDGAYWGIDHNGDVLGTDLHDTSAGHILEAEILADAITFVKNGGRGGMSTGQFVGTGGAHFTIAPVISGTALVGSTLTCNGGTAAGTPTPAKTYQWKRAGTNISGATASTYVLAGGDVSNAITCTVTATNTGGSANSTSNAITPSVPVNTVAPAVTGTTTTGQTLTCSTGTWTSAATPTYGYVWKRNGSAISGATSSTYVLQVADEGTSVKCTVTATNANGNASQDSNTVSPTASATAPGQVTGLSLTPANNSLVATWTAPSNGGSAITDYKVEIRNPGGSGSYTIFADGTSTTAGTTITGLTNGTSVDVRVSAINAIGTGTASSVVSATPAGTFDPASLSSKDFWLKPEDLGSGTQTTWTDAFSLSHSPTQATAGNRPTVLSNALNGLKGVQFDGAGDNLQWQGNAGADSHTPVTRYFLARFTDNDIDSYIADGWAGNFGLYHSAGDSNFNLQAGDVTYGPVANHTSYHVWTCWDDGTNCKLFVDGVQVGSTTASINGYIGGLVLGISRGGAIGGTPSTSKVEIVEAIGYTAAHDNTVRGQVETYLKNRGGL